MISVLLPTRGRPSPLAASIASLRDLADHPIEVLCAVDTDDPDTEEQARALADKTIPFERRGYAQLHRYYNVLARAAIGDWLLLWNDDTEMTTRGWDTIIERHDKTSVLMPRTNHHPWLNPFPVVPTWMHRCAGVFSRSCHCDTWWEEINKRLHRSVGTVIDVHVVHHRADITGENDDATYRERVLEGPAFYNNPQYRDEIDLVAKRIRKHLGAAA